MKILMVSVFSNHFFNWVLQLKETEHEIYWFDINDANTYVKRIDFIQQTVNWKRKYNYPGRQWLKNNWPRLYGNIEKINQRNFLDVFKKRLEEIQPDVVQSFEMHSACVPISVIMDRHPNVKWIYSAWGNDIFYYQKEPEKLKEMKAVFKRLDYMFADCTRDYIIAGKYGFKGNYLGTYPTGGGYEFNFSDYRLVEFKNRKTILIKGYEHKFGRGIKILDALLEIAEEIKDFRIVVFASKEKIINHGSQAQFKKIGNLEFKGQLARGEVLDLMGQSLIYVGNSISDGTPNTLLEAIIMEAFPIQSDPGGATSEIIEDGKNGFLIKDPENSHEIASHIKRAVKNLDFVRKGIAFNTEYVKPKLEREYIKLQVLEKYKLVEESLVQ